jgi:hypothetical protein
MDGPPGQAADRRQRGGVQPGLPRTLRRDRAGDRRAQSGAVWIGRAGRRLRRGRPGQRPGGTGSRRVLVVTAAPAPRPGSTQMRSRSRVRVSRCPGPWIGSLRPTHNAQICTARVFIGIQPTPRQIGGSASGRSSGVGHAVSPFRSPSSPRDKGPGPTDIGDDSCGVSVGVSVIGYRDASLSASGWARRWCSVRT